MPGFVLEAIPAIAFIFFSFVPPSKKDIVSIGAIAGYFL